MGWPPRDRRTSRDRALDFRPDEGIVRGYLQVLLLGGTLAFLTAGAAVPSGGAGSVIQDWMTRTWETGDGLPENSATAMVQTADGQSVGGAMAETLLHDSLGFDAPLASLAYWLRGCDDPSSAADTTLDDQQRLATLKQQGWQVSYDGYERHGALWLPQRITLQRDAVRLKLLIQTWTLTG